MCLRHGSEGPAVEALQAELGLATDGVFGPGTKLALARLQMAELGYATGSFSPEMARLLRVDSFPDAA